MHIKIIAVIFICFYSGLSFSQTKKMLCFFERDIAVSEGNGKCFGFIYRQGIEHYSVSLFSDSTFVITYSRKGTAFPKYRKNEMATGKFFNQNDSIFIVTNCVTELVHAKYSYLSRLEQWFGILPLSIEFSGNGLSFYNSDGLFLSFQEESIFEKYKKSSSLRFPVTYISPKFSNNRLLF